MHYSPVLGGGENRNGSLILNFKSEKRHSKRLFGEVAMGALETNGCRGPYLTPNLINLRVEGAKCQLH